MDLECTEECILSEEVYRWENKDCCSTRNLNSSQEAEEQEKLPSYKWTQNKITFGEDKHKPQKMIG